MENEVLETKPNNKWLFVILIISVIVILAVIVLIIFLMNNSLIPKYQFVLNRDYEVHRCEGFFNSDIKINDCLNDTNLLNNTENINLYGSAAADFVKNVPVVYSNIIISLKTNRTVNSILIETSTISNTDCDIQAYINPNEKENFSATYNQIIYPSEDPYSQNAPLKSKDSINISASKYIKEYGVNSFKININPSGCDLIIRNLTIV